MSISYSDMQKDSEGRILGSVLIVAYIFLKRYQSQFSTNYKFKNLKEAILILFIRFNYIPFIVKSNTSLKSQLYVN